MQVAIRSSLTAGVAVVAASALLMSPVSPSAAPDIQVPAISAAKVSTTSVELAALVNPFALWAEVLATTVGNVGGLANTVLANPFPILSSVVQSQLVSAQVLTTVVTTFGEGLLNGLAAVPETAQAAIEQILAGDLAQGIPALFSGIFINPIAAAAFGILLSPTLFTDLVTVLQNPFQNIVNAIGEAVSFNTIINVGLPLLTEVLAPVQQIGATAQAIYDGIGAGNLEAIANALISFPSDMVNTILNGNPAFFNNGLLGVPAGLFASLLGLQQAIANVITPPALTPPALRQASDDTSISGISSLPDVNLVSQKSDSSLNGKLAAEGDPATATTGATDVVTGTENITAPEVKPAPAPEPDAESAPVKEKASDTRINTKKGNKVVPGQVKTAVADNGSSPKTEAEPTATDDNTGTTGTGATGSESSDSGDSDGGGSDE
jgi:hypothetical protein